MFSNPPTFPIFARAFGGGVQPGVAHGARAACRGRLWQACLLGAVIALSLTAGAKAQPGGQYFNLSSTNYSENFSNISSWNNNFINTPTNQNVWKASALGTDGISFGGSSAWVTGGSGGIEKGNQALIIFNNSGNLNDAAAVNLCMNFSNRVAGTLSFRWAKLTNGVSQFGNSSDLRIRFSTNGGTNWSNLAEGGTNALPLRINNNGVPQSNTLTVALPSTINNRTNVEFQFYVWHNGQNTGGDRPKFVLDDVAVTSTPFGPPSVEVGARTNFTSNGVTFVSNVVTAENGSSITERGVVWSYGMFNPTTNDTKVVVPGTDLNPYSVTLTNLTNSIFVRAYAINSSGVGYSTNVQQYRPPPFFPNPTLAGRNATTNSFDLTWTSANNHESYSLRVDDDPAFLSPISVPGIFNTATNTTVNTGLLPGTLYSVRLEASNLFGTATNSTTQWTVPLAPTNLGGQSLATTEFTARWAVTTGATNGYRLDVDDASDFGSPVSGFNNLTVNSTNQLVSGLTAGTQYFFRVRAVNPGGTSANSTNFSQWTLPDAPFNLAAASITAGGFSASWEQPVSATGYRLDVDDSADFSSPLSGFNNLTVSGTTQSVAGLAAGTEYYFRVRAVNPGGTGASSTNFSQWTLPAAPADLAASGISTNGFTVTWSATLSATSYRLDVDDSADFSSPESGYNDLTVSGTSQVISGLAPDTTYFVRVRAVNPAGTGASSTLSQDTDSAEVPPPTRTLSIGGTLGNFSTIFGTASAAQSFTVSGEDLSSTPLRVVPPIGYEVSLTSDFSGTVGTNGSPLILGTESTVNTIVFIRLAATTPVGSAYTGNVVVRGGGATQQTLSIPGGVVEPDVPGAPTLGTITAGPNQLSVAFTPPTYDGGSAITNYEYSLDDGATFITASPALTSGPLVITGLSSATTYTVRLRAVNVAGNGPASNSGTGTPTAPTAPTAPALGSTNVTFGSGPNTFTMEFVPVGNPGNAANAVVTTLPPDPMAPPGPPTTVTNFIGAVPYSFRMAKFEVTRGMVSAVNSAGMMNLALRPSPPGGTGTNQPAMGISWNMMARFVNWLNTSQGFSPAYKFSRSASPMDGNDDNIQLWATNDPGYNPANPFRNANAVYVLPSEDEWYKAAFHGGTNKYWLYPTAQDAAPQSVASGTNGAVYSGMGPGETRTNPATVNLAGGPSFYGTVGQGGNVWEMTESSLSRTNNSATNGRIQYGGDWTSFSNTLANNFRSGFAVPPTNSASYNNVGFRVAQILPVPSAPTIVSITPGDRQLSVAFTPPTSDGGEAISNYEYSIDGGLTYTAFSPTQSTSPLVITGLVNGTTYPVRIKAVNAAGAGAASNSVNGTPVGSPALNLGGTLSAFGATYGTASAVQSFTVDGSNLNSTEVTLRPPVGYELSLSEDFSGTVGTNGSPLSLGSGTAIGSTTVYVRLAATATGGSSYRGNITLSGGGATTRSLAISSGTVNKAAQAPVTGSITVGSVNVGGTSAAVGAGGSGTGVYQYRIKDSVTGVVTLASNGAISAVGAGTAEIEVRRLGDQNYLDSDWVSAGTVTVTASVASPSLSLGALSGTGTFTTTFGTPSTAQSFTVEGSNLDGTAVTVTPPAGYEVSLTSDFATVGTSGSPLSLGTAASINSTPVYVRLASGNAVGSYSGDITVSGGGATTQTVAVSGTVNKADQGSVSGTIVDDTLTVGETTTVSGTGGSGTGVYEYRVKGGGSSVVTVASDGTITAVGTGSAEIEVRRLGDSNYNDSDWGSAGTVTVSAPAASLSVSGTLSSFTTTFGTPSVAQSFTVSGSNLDGTAVTVTPPAGYEVSLTSDFASVGTSGSPLSLGTATSISGTPVYVRLASGNAVGSSYTGNISVSGGGGTTQTVAITSGTVNKAEQETVQGVIDSSSLTMVSNSLVTASGGSGTGIYEYRVKDGGSSVVTVDVDGTITPMGVGEAEIEVRRLGDDQYLDTDWISAGTVTVSKAEQDPITASVDEPNLVLGQLSSVTYFGGSGSGSFEFRIKDGVSSVVEVDSDGAITTIGVGTVEIEVRRLGDNQYLDTDWVSAGTVTVSDPIVDEPALTLGAWSEDGIFTTTGDAASDAQSFTVEGSNLDTNLPVTVTPPEGYEVSLDPDFGTVGTITSPLELDTSTGEITATVYVRLALGNAVGSSYTGNIEVSGGGATPQTVAVSGTVNAVPPGAPTLGAITAGDGQLSVAFTPPTSDGGAEISNYEYSTDGGLTFTPLEPEQTTGPLVITGLDNGTTYTVVIRAVNSAGVGEESNSGEGTPVAPTGTLSVSGTLSGFTASFGTNSVAQSFTVSGSNLDGTAVTVTPPAGYEVSLDENFGTSSTSLSLGTATSISGTTVYVRLASGNAVGSSYAGNISVSGGGATPQTVAVSGTVNAVPPGAPTLGVITAGDGELSVAFTPPTSDGGAEISNYEYSTDGGQTFTAASPVDTTSPLVITGLTNGTTYTVVIRAVNSAGVGTPSNSGSGTPVAPTGTLSVSGTLSSFTASFGTNSVAQSFTVSGSNLDGTAVTVTPPAGYEVSLTSDFATVGTSGAPLSLGTATSISGTTVYVRLASGSAVGSSYTGNISVSGGGATTQTVAVSGTVNKADQGSVSGTIGDTTLTVGETTTVSGTGGSGTGVYEYRVKGGGSSVVTVASNGTITAVGTGSAEIEVRRLGDSNYNDSAWGSAGFVTVSASSSSVVANNITLERDGRGGSTTSIHVGQILAANSYAPNAPLTVSLPSGATAQGGSVSRDHRWILYTSSVSLPSSSADSFTYTITDGSGASATGTVTLTAGDYSAVAANIVSVVEATAPVTGKFVTFAVTPNFSYHVYASSSLGGSAVWSNTQTNGNPHAAGQHGFITIHDAQAGSVRFYKLEVDRP